MLRTDWKKGDSSTDIRIRTDEKNRPVA
jgi:hypothetical protein